MTEKQARRNIFVYYVFTMIKEPIFWGVIVVEMIGKISSMNQAEINAMEAFCMLISIAIDIPTGALADHIGRRKMLFLGSILILFEVLIFSQATSVAEVWIANLISFAGYACQSGSDSALLKDSLKFLGRDENEHRKILYQAGAAKYLLTAVTALITGQLAQIDIRLPGYISLVPLSVCLVVSLLFTETPYAGQDRYNFKEHWRKMAEGVSYVMRHNRILWCIAFIMMISIVGKIWFFSYNAYFRTVGLNYSTYGVVFCLLNLVAAISSFSTKWLQSRLGAIGSMIVAVVCLSVPLMVMGTMVLPICAYLVVFQNVVRGYFDPFIKDLYQRHTESETRATVTSVQSTCQTLGQFVAMYVFSRLLLVWSLPSCLIVLGTFALVAGTTLILAYRRVFATA